MGMGSSCCTIQQKDQNEQILTDVVSKQILPLISNEFEVFKSFDSKRSILEEIQSNPKKRPELIIQLNTKEVGYISNSSEHTPGFAENSQYYIGSKRSFSSVDKSNTHKLSIHSNQNETNSNQIIFVGELQSPPKEYQSKQIQKQNTAFKPGNSPIPKFNNTNKLLEVSQNNKKLRSVSAETEYVNKMLDNNVQDLQIKQLKGKSKLSRSFTINDLEQKTQKLLEQSKDDLISQASNKKSNLKKNLKYQNQKRNNTYKEGNTEYSQKKVRFDQVLQQQQQQNKN